MLEGNLWWVIRETSSTGNGSCGVWVEFTLRVFSNLEKLTNKKYKLYGFHSSYYDEKSDQGRVNISIHSFIEWRNPSAKIIVKKEDWLRAIDDKNLRVKARPELPYDFLVGELSSFAPKVILDGTADQFNRFYNNPQISQLGFYGNPEKAPLKLPECYRRRKQWEF